MNRNLLRPGTLIALLAAALLALPAAAQQGDGDVPGEVMIATNVEFVKFQVNGKKEWENHEYTNRHKTLVVMGLDRLDTNTIVLTPRQEGFKAVTLTLTEADFRRAKVRHHGRRVTVYLAKKRVKFTKNGTEVSGDKKKAKKKAKKKKAKKKKAKKKSRK